MSKIELKSIHVTQSPIPIPDFTVGGIVDASSGYPYPKYIDSIKDLNTYFGDISDYSFYAELIAKGIPAYLLPMLSKYSSYNRSSLRFTENPKLVSNPEITKSYFSDWSQDTYSDEEVGIFEKISIGEYSFRRAIDFSQLTIKDFNPLTLVTRAHTVNTCDPNSNDKTPKGVRVGIIYYKDINPGLSEYDYDASSGGLITIQVTDEDTVESLINRTVDEINTLECISKAYTEETLVKALYDSYLDSDGNLTISLDDLIELAQSSELEPLSSKEIEAWLRYLDHDSNQERPKIKYIIIQSKSLGEKFTVYDALENTLQTSNQNIRSISTWFDEHVLSYLTNSIKTVEFFSKIRGHLGSGIYLNITKLEPSIYSIQISNRQKTEDYTVTLGQLDPLRSDVIHISSIGNQSELVDVEIFNYRTDNGELLNDRDLNMLDIEFSPNNIRDISSFELPEGIHFLDRAVLEVPDASDYCNSTELYRQSKIFPDVFTVPTLWSRDCIESLIKLSIDDNNDNKIDESCFTQVLINLDHNQINSDYAEYLTSDLKSGFISKENRLLYFYGNIISLDHSFPLMITYVLNLYSKNYLDYPVYNFSYSDFDRKVFGTLIIGVDSDYESLLITELKVEGELTYVVTLDRFNKLRYGVIKNDIFYEVSQLDYQVISDVPNVDGKPITSITDYCNAHHINYPNYDTVSYYFDVIREFPNQGNVFVLRTIESKYTRSIYEIASQLRGQSLNYILGRINDINSKCKKLFPLIQSSTVDHELKSNGEILQIQFSIKIKEIVNKTFKLIINLNI